MEQGISRDGLILVLLRAQLAIAVGMVLLAPLAGGVILFFTQLPGGLMDAATSAVGQDSALYAGLFHILYGLALFGFLYGLFWDGRERLLLAVQALGAVLVFPFGVVLAYQAWRISDADGWEDASHDAARVGRRGFVILAVVWAMITLLSSVGTVAAYIGFLDGQPLAALFGLMTAIALQWVGLRSIIWWQSRTELATFGSPMPELPDLDG